MDRLYEEFGQLLRKRRLAAHLTQSEVAERVGLTRTSITNIERGRQHILLHQLFLLASAVGARPDELLPDHDATLEDLVPAQTLKRLRGSKEEDLDVVVQLLKSARVAATQGEGAAKT